MKHFIDHLTDVINQSPEHILEPVAVNWSHQFNVQHEGLLPQWSSIVKLESLKPATVELDWLLRNESDLEILHEAGYHHRDYLLLDADAYVTREYTFDQRIELAIKEFELAGLTLTGKEALSDAFLENGMMAKYLTLDNCLNAMGCHEVRDELVGKEGTIGKVHSSAFLTPSPSGALLFHSPQYLPDPEQTIEERLGAGLYTHLPKQVILNFVRTDLGLGVRLGMLNDSHDPKRVALIQAILEEKSYGDLVELGFDVPEEEYLALDRSVLLHQCLSATDIPEASLHARLQLTDLSPLKEYATEVLPYMVYAEYVAHKNNMVNETFTLDVNYLHLDKETVGMVEVIQSGDLQYQAPAKINMDRDQESSLLETPITVEQLNVSDYIGL